MPADLRDSLVRLQPRNKTIYASQGRTVLATSPDGFIFEHEEHGLDPWLPDLQRAPVPQGRTLVAQGGSPGNKSEV